MDLEANHILLGEAIRLSYFIEYDSDLKTRYPLIVKRNRGKLVRTTLITTILFAAGFVFVKTRAYEWLIPGNPDVTVPAFSGMINDFVSGVPVREAVTNFCREVITGVS